MKKEFLKIGMGLSLLHVLLTLALLVFIYQSSMDTFDQPEQKETKLVRFVKPILNILQQPIATIWKQQTNGSLQAFEWLFFLLNSSIWGFSIAWIIKLGKRYI